MSDYTPGPWRILPTSRPAQWLVVAGDDTMDRHNGDSFSLQFKEANARLIAEAPNMLTALRNLSAEVLASLSLMEPLCRREFGNTNYNILIQRAEEARAFIAKIEGETK